MKCEVSHNYITDYAEGRIELPMRVVLESHLADCAACREELDNARELVELFRDLPRVDPPANFRAQVLERVSQRSPSRVWFGQWGLPSAARLSMAGVAAVLAVGLLFTQTTVFDTISSGPSWTPNIPAVDAPPQAPSATQPELLVSGTPGPYNPLKHSARLNLILQPKEEFRGGKILLADLSQGINCETEGVDTERGRVLWQGSLAAGQRVSLPLVFRATQPGVHRVLLQIESEDKSSRRMIFLPAFSKAERVTSDTLIGERSVTDTLTELARHFGVVIVTDLTRQRPYYSQIKLSLPGRAVAQVAAQRNLQWRVSNGVYNLYETPKESAGAGR